MPRALQMIAALKRQVARYPDRMALARTAAQARRIVARGQLAAFLGLEGGYVIRDDPNNLKPLYDQGVRYMTLTWRHNTGWADGSEDTPRHHGLTALGRRVVREMNRLGMVVDVSHVSDETFWDVLKTTSRPVIASHSNARALCDHPRNLTDPMLRALAKNGGVVGVNFAAVFIDQAYSEQARRRVAAIEPELERLRQGCAGDPAACRNKRHQLYHRALRGLPRVPLARLLDHIDHMVKVAGVDHVGLGSDFDGFGTGPEGLEDVSRLPRITRGLLARGYSEHDVRKILGQNFMRVFEQAIDHPQASDGAGAQRPGAALRARWARRWPAARPARSGPSARAKGRYPAALRPGPRCGWW
jgi:membrane dipeptidase